MNALFHEDDAGSGWSGLDAAVNPKSKEAEPDTLAEAYARTFATPRGALVLADLTHVLRRVVQPARDGDYLRHVEGQRHVAIHILDMIERGKDV